MFSNNCIIFAFYSISEKNSHYNLLIKAFFDS